jgi:ABC-type branched-subunit amino acid transport system substrate-binding protein
MKPQQRAGAFPPPLGWIPITIALALVTIASIVAFVPQYGNHQLVGVTNNTGPTAGESGAGGDTQLAGGGGAATPNAGNGGGGGNVGPKAAGTPGGPAAATGDCAHGKNAGATATGVSSTTINIATTDVTTGIGSGFLGEAVQGMRAAIDQVNHAGGICGRHVALQSVNDGWDGPTGNNYISGFINSGNVFALVGEPDSEGLDAAVKAGSIDRAGIPVVGTDGMLASQYNDPWVWPVAASTVTNMHIMAQYAHDVLHAKKVGIVYDSVYKFGKEGAAAFAAEVQRLNGNTAGMDKSKGCGGGFCGVSPSSTDYSSPIHDFNSYCSTQAGASKQCDVVVMLLEPQPMETWMKGEENCSCTWFTKMMGGEPLFDDGFANNCAQDCSGMIVWSGYKPDIQPFDAQTPVYTYASALRSVCGTCDPHNEFTEGAYLGTKLFIAACQKVGANLTRAALQQELNSDTFDLGLSLPLHFGAGLPHLANASMVAFQDNASGTFNGWSYMQTGFLKDPAPGLDLKD